MDWLLAALALVNVLSMLAVFSSREVARKSVPWALFGLSVLAIELAWIWLPLQVLLVALMSLAGALDSALGAVSMAVVAVAWLGLLWCIWMSSKAGAAVENALVAGLGDRYRDDIPAPVRSKLRTRIRFRDWCRPFAMQRPGVEVIRHVPYGPGGVRQQLDIYRPRELPEEGCPVLLQIHGGAWVMGDKGQQALPLMYELASKGWICVAANYRLSPSVGFPTHLQDCKAALCWIREQGAAYGMNADFVAVTGGSAGGHLTALMGLTANLPELQPQHPDTDTSVQAFVPFYGVYDFAVRYQQHLNLNAYRAFLEGKVLHESLEDNPGLWDLASPIAQIREDAPPCMAFHGTRDSLAALAEGRVFCERLARVSKNPVVYVEMPGAEHAWDTVHSLRTEHTVAGVHRFLEWVRARHAGGRAEDPATRSEQSTGAATSAVDVV
jgi:acetyl esterase/lipase